MSPDPPPKHPRLQPFTLGDWAVDPRACHVSHGDTVIKLRPQLVDLLVCLARRAGEIVLKEEILAEVWPGQFIAESGLSRCIAELRQILQDDAQQPRYIETITKRGYRMVAAVGWVTAPAGAAQPAAASGRRTSDAGLPTPDAGLRTPAAGLRTPDAGLRGSTGSPRLERENAAVEGRTPDAGRLEADAGAATQAAATAAEAFGGSRDGGQRGTRDPVSAGLPTRTGRPVLSRHGVWATIGVFLVAVAVIAALWARRAPAKAVLTERDPVLLAFENRTGEAVFDETIPLAVSMQLEQSPYLAVVPSGRVREVLVMMQRPPDTAVTRAVGLEVCERLVARALIVTSVARHGAQYVIGLEAVACGSGTVLARRQATTDRKERVLGALQHAADDIRVAVGESAASLQRYQVPLVEATTVSLDALRLVRRGDVARERGQSELAASLYRDAVAYDRTFALAYARLGRVADGAEQVEALKKAYDLRRHVTLPEGLEIEAAYHRVVTRQRARVVEALEQLTRSYPRRAVPRRDLVNEYVNIGRYEAALSEAREARRLEPDSVENVAALSYAHLFLNQIAEARQVAESLTVVGTPAVDLHSARFLCAVAANDTAVMARERAWAAEHPDEAWWWGVESEVVIGSGQLREAVSLTRKYEAWAIANNDPDTAITMRFRAARYEAVCGLHARAMRTVEAESARGLSSRAKVNAAGVALLAGRVDVAERLLDDADRDPDPSDWVAVLGRTYRAAVAANRGRSAQALDLLAPLQPLQWGYAYNLEPAYVRAQVHYLAGDWASARAAFEEFLSHSTIHSGRRFQHLALLGLARTLAHAGDLAASRRTYEQFFDRWRHADAGLPVLLDARREYAALVENPEIKRFSTK